jgi:hypothetical protein
LGLTPKFKIQLPRLFSRGHDVYKKVCQSPAGPKLREEIDFLETGRFQPRAVPLRPADLRPSPKNYLHGVGLVLKISLRSFHSIKNYSYFSDRQTDRPTNIQTNIQTDRHTDRHTERQTYRQTDRQTHALLFA